MDDHRLGLLFIVNSLGVGGAEMQTVTLANQLDPSRFKLSLAYLKDEVGLLPQVDHARIGGRVFCCNVAKRIDGQAIRQLASHIRDNRVDAVMCTNTYALLYGWLARIVSGRRPKIVAVFHSTTLDSIKDKLQMLFYRPLFWFSDMLVYVCENQKTHWHARALWARHELVIHNGIDVDRFTDHYSRAAKAVLRQRYGFHSSDYVVGICALMRPEKAHGDLLEAIENLRAAGVDVKCLLIGDGPDRARIEEEISHRGLAGHVCITGLLVDVRPAIAACDVMAIVSHSVETFSISALESMALGKPMVMTDIGGASEQVVQGENGFLYARGDITALAQGLRQLMHSHRNAEMGARARTIVTQRFSLGAMVGAYERMFIRLETVHA